jgi:hypothetical protein
MRTTRFLIAIIAFGALTLGPVFAGEPSNLAPGWAPSENRAKTASDRSPGARRGEERPVSAKRTQSSGTKTTAKPHPGLKLPQAFQANGGHPGEKRTDSAQTKGTSANAAELHQPGLNRSAGGAKAGSIVNEMEKQHRLPVAGLSGTPLPNQVAHSWVPGQAFIGGPAISSARNTAVLNGTGMKHKL